MSEGPTMVVESSVGHKNDEHQTIVKDVDENSMDFADSQPHAKKHKLENGTALNGDSKTKVQKLLAIIPSFSCECESSFIFGVIA